MKSCARGKVNTFCQLKRSANLSNVGWPTEDRSGPVWCAVPLLHGKEGREGGRKLVRLSMLTARLACRNYTQFIYKGLIGTLSGHNVRVLHGLSGTRPGLNLQSPL